MTVRTRMESRLRRVAGSAPRRLGSRRAFTLVEVLLTLAILVIMAGVTWSALQRPLARQRLHSAVDAVRTDWCQARVDAMKSGHTYSFRYLVHGDRYHLGPQEDPAQTDFFHAPSCGNGRRIVGRRTAAAAGRQDAAARDSFPAGRCRRRDGFHG